MFCRKGSLALPGPASPGWPTLVFICKQWFFPFSLCLRAWAPSFLSMLFASFCFDPFQTLILGASCLLHSSCLQLIGHKSHMDGYCLRLTSIFAKQLVHSFLKHCFLAVIPVWRGRGRTHKKHMSSSRVLNSGLRQAPSLFSLLALKPACSDKKSTQAYI